MSGERLRIWIKAIRAPFFTASIIPVILGAVLAWHDNSVFYWQRFWFTLLGAVLIHAGTNLANDYFDHCSGCDEANANPTPFSGGSRVIQEKEIPAKSIFFAAVSCCILGGIIGLYLNYLSGSNVILVLGIIGVFLGFFYAAKPFRIVYGGFGELAVGIGFGALIILGTYYVQARHLSLKALLISLPIDILIALVLFINEFPDYTADKSVGKKTLVVILGKNKAMVLYHILLAAVYLAILFLVFFKFLPLFCLIAMLTLPLALKSYIVSKKYFDKVYELLPANALTIALHSTVGILLSIGLALDKLI